MTVKQLKEMLKEVPDDYRVDIYCNMYINQANNVEQNDMRKLFIITDEGI